MADSVTGLTVTTQLGLCFLREGKEYHFIVDTMGFDISPPLAYTPSTAQYTSIHTSEAGEAIISNHIQTTIYIERQIERYIKHKVCDVHVCPTLHQLVLCFISSIF